MHRNYRPRPFVIYMWIFTILRVCSRGGARPYTCVLKVVYVATGGQKCHTIKRVFCNVAQHVSNVAVFFSVGVQNCFFSGTETLKIINSLSGSSQKNQINILKGEKKWNAG